MYGIIQNLFCSQVISISVWCLKAPKPQKIAFFEIMQSQAWARYCRVNGYCLIFIIITDRCNIGPVQSYIYDEEKFSRVMNV